jgi:hypothetical protein
MTISTKEIGKDVVVASFEVLSKTVLEDLDKFKEVVKIVGFPLD